MHDLHLANKIFNLVLKHAKKNNLQKVTKATIELGRITEHGQEINPENLKFHLKNLARNPIDKDARFLIKKVKGDNFWKLVEIEGE